jgi:hypothetical protein
MLFDNFLADKEDRFYFMFAFVVRAWFSLLFFVFVPFLFIHFGYHLDTRQFLVIGSSYLLMGALDFVHVFGKALKEHRYKRWVYVQHNGLKNYR